MSGLGYAYDSANRLVEVSNQSSVSSYQYNGLGDRLSQTVDGIATDYTLDLNTGLTQVLYDGTTTYAYGLGRIAQTDTTTEYFLGDALGSVRQMTDSTGEITFAQTYDPYGTVTSTSGLSHTDYGFTGESYSPSTQLTYLRARYYDPAEGRFTSRDTWGGDARRPLSLNRWGYVEGNPINAIDPSGYITENQAKKAKVIVDKLKMIYNVHVERDWGYRIVDNQNLLFRDFIDDETLRIWLGCQWQEGNWRDVRELEWTLKGVKKMAEKLGGAGKFRAALAGMQITFRRMPDDKGPNGSAAWTELDVEIYNDTYKNGEMAAGAIVTHELAHVWDTRQSTVFNLSTKMYHKTGSFSMLCSDNLANRLTPSCYQFNKTGEAPPTGYGESGPREDFAESFTVCVYPSFKNSLGLGPIRKQYIEGLINGNKCSQ
jgi:RHS repeat-associated protein